MRPLAAPVLALALAACGGAATVTTATRPIIAGSDDSGDPAVVMVLSQVPGSTSGNLCSGAIVSPHVVLTAAHCVDPSVVGMGVRFEVFVGPVLNNMAPMSDFFGVAETHFDTAFNKGDPTAGHDVGIVILKAPTSIAPLAFNRSPLASSLIGQPGRLVGYGITSASDTMGTTAGTRRQAPTKLNSVDPLLVGFEDGTHSICEGDSGGPAFMTLGGKELIVGVTSYGFTNCPPSSPGMDTRVDAYTGFIDPYVLQFDPPAAKGGDSCQKDSDCAPLLCLGTSVGNLCAQACDPSAMSSGCPMGTTCTSVDGSLLCAKPSGHKSGCDFGGGAPAGLGAIWLALVALSLRRRVRS